MKLFRHGLYFLGALALIVFATVLSFSIFHIDCGYDREVFRYLGMVIANGGAPYADGFDHKPPMLYFLYALVHRWDPQGPWLLETFLLAVSAISLFFLAISRRWPLPFLYPLYFVALLRDSNIVVGGGTTRSYGATFTAMAIAVIMLELRYASLLFGLLFATCFFLQQNDAMPLGVLFVFFLLRKNHRAREIAWFAAGSALVALPLFSWFLYKGAFSDFIDQAFLFNTRLYLGHNVIGDLPNRLRRSINDFGFRHWFMAAGILFALLPRRVFWNLRELHQAPLAFAFLALLGEMVMMNLSGVLFPNYFVALVAWVILFTGELFRLYANANVLPKRYVYFLLLATLYVLPNPNIARAWKESVVSARKGLQTPVCSAAVEKYAQEVAGQRGQFYSFSEVMHLSLNRHYNIIAPSKWVYLHFWNQLPRERWDTDRQEFKKILASIDYYKTKYIYFENTRAVPPFYAPDLNELWFSYLESHYAPVEQNIWRRKSQ